MLDRRPAGVQGFHWQTRACSTLIASPSIRWVTSSAVGTIKEDLRDRVAVHARPNPAK
jgi:hypothetical protein